VTPERHSEPGTEPVGATQRHLRRVPFANYEVVVILGSQDEFLGIAEVSVRRSFLSADQIVDSSGHYDVSDLYRD